MLSVDVGLQNVKRLKLKYFGHNKRHKSFENHI